MTDRPLTLAISDYDHVRDLTSGKVKPQGIDLTSLEFPVEEIFFRFAAYREWHASEFSMAKYVSLRASGDESLTAIPVFPSRVFRHSSIYVRVNGSVRAPEELTGRRVGVPEWAQTAGVYARALLMHDYGVPLESVQWVQGGVHQPGRQEQAPIALPDGVRLEVVSDRSLEEMLLAGDLDAVITAHPPYDERIVRLIDDYPAVEADYYRRTGIFPIMHIVALRRDVFDADPWVAMNLLKAFEEARRRSVARVREITASRLPIPWSAARFDEAAGLLGHEPWSYGLEPNRTTLGAFLRYCHEQGVAQRELRVEELVPAEVRSSFRI